jgi:beta-glucosidase
MSRHEFDVHPTQRDLNDTYLPAFRAAIVEGKADSVMCAYNSVNGMPACVNTDLLQRKLKDEWGFRGYVVSDCGAIADIFRGHKYKATAAEASAAAVKAGTDLTCGNEYRSLVDAVKNGFITEAEINTSLERLFVARFRLGMFDPPERVPFSAISATQIDSEAHRKLALEAARKSIVLLRNDDQVLPLRASVKKIAVIGPAADDAEALLGNYNGFSSKQVSSLAGIEKQFAGKADIRFALGSTYTARTHAPIPAGALTPADGTGHGLTAEYFDNPRFEGAAKVRRVEARPDAGSLPDGALLAAGIPRTGFSVRWTGTLHAPVTGDYLLGVRNAGGYSSAGRGGALAMHVYIDDREVVGDTAAQGLARVREAHASLDAGRAYNLRVQYGPAVAASGAQMTWIPPAEALLAEAVGVVKKADVALVFVGLNSNLEGEEMPVAIPGFSGGDRTNIELPQPQKKLIDTALGSGKPVVVVVSTGSAVSVNAPAVIEAWYGGEEAGTAIAETIAGVNNPAGRLPVTFYKSVDQLPPFDDYSMQGRTYRYFRGDALYGFGFGLSYSTFRYSNLQAQRSASGGRVSVRVRNASNRDGDEVVQLYIEGAGGADEAIRQLRGFERVHLKAGESRDVTFTIPAGEIPQGKARISVGGGQPVGSVPRVTGFL